MDHLRAKYRNKKTISCQYFNFLQSSPTVLLELMFSTIDLIFFKSTNPFIRLTSRMKGKVITGVDQTGLISTSDKSSICIRGFMKLAPPPTDIGICLITGLLPALRNTNTFYNQINDVIRLYIDKAGLADNSGSTRMKDHNIPIEMEKITGPSYHGRRFSSSDIIHLK